MEWNGYKKEVFIVDGREGFLVFPKKFEENKRWVWRAEFFGGFDYADRALIEKGFTLAYYCASDMFGCPEAVDAMKKFHDHVVENYGLNKKADIFGFSRGGLYTVNYTAKYPEDVATIYLDAPVLSLESWPGMFGKTKEYRNEICLNEWEKCKKVYGFSTDEEMLSYKEIPLNKVDALIAANIPVIIVAGDSDKTVDYTENGEIFAREYKEKGGDIKLIVKEGVDHHPHSLEEPSPIVDFIISHKV